MSKQPSRVHASDVGRPLTSLPVLLTGPEGPESFASHVDRAAAYQVLPLPVIALLARAGVMSADRFDLLPYGYGVDMSEDQISGFAQVFGLREPEVRAMLLRSFDGLAIDLTGLDVNDPKRILAVAQREWAGFRGSRCCPGCLGETKGWRLRWKLWFTFACLTHRALLVDRCPRCQRLTGNYREDSGLRPSFPGLVLKPGFCNNPLPVGVAASGRAGRPCGQDLSQIQRLCLDDAVRLLETQRQLYAVLEAGRATVAGKVVPSLTYFEQLRSLMALVLFIGQPGDLGELPPEIHEAARLAFQERDTLWELPRNQQKTRYQPFRAAPSDVRLIAAVLPLACELLAQPDQAAVALTLRPFISRIHRSRGNGAVRTMASQLRFQGVLMAALEDLLVDRADFSRSVGHLARGQAGQYATFLPGHVPPLLWLDIYRRDFAPLLEGSDLGEAMARATISMALVKLCGKYSWVESEAVLDLVGPHRFGSTGRLIGYLKKHGNIETFQKALHHLAAWLSARNVPTDFGARRKALEHFTLIPEEQWDVIASDAGFHRRRMVPLRRNAAAWVWIQLTGSDHRFSPALNQDPQRRHTIRNTYRKFEQNDLPRLEFKLKQLVEEMEREL